MVEGKLIHCQHAIFPCSDPPEIAKYYQFDDTAKVISCDDYGEAISQNSASIGFWSMYDDILSTPTGLPDDPILAHLTTHRIGYKERPDYILMPYPSTDSIVRADDGESLLAISYEITIESLRELKSQAKLGSPIRLPLILGVAKWDDEMWAYEADIRAAADTWNIASGRVDYKLKQFFVSMGASYMPPTHNKIRWADSLPPSGASDNQPLASTVTGKIPTQFWANPIKFNRSYSWTAPGSTPVTGSGQFDFVSVMMHELGHAFAIGHLNANTNNVMFRSIGTGQIKRVLQSDDINFLGFLYG